MGIEFDFKYFEHMAKPLSNHLSVLTRWKCLL